MSVRLGRMRRFAWVIVLLNFALFVAGWALGGASKHARVPPDFALVMNSRWLQLTPVFALTFAVVGALIISRRPDNLIGWVSSGIGLLSGLYTFAGGWVLFGRYAYPHTLPAVELAQWFLDWEWVLPVVLTLFFLPFLFPDGRPVDPRWWPLAAFAVLDVLLAMLPIGGTRAATLAGGLGTTAGLIADVGAIVSLVIRYRRSSGDERQQLRWFFGAAIVLVVVAVSAAFDSFVFYHNPTVVFIPVFDVLVPLALTGLAVSIGIAVLRYHLYDIDFLLRQTLVYGALVFLIGFLYFVLIVSLAQRFAQVNTRDPAVPAVFAAIVAIAFQPVRARLQRLANRIVYGQRATPYEVLAGFNQRVSEMYAPEELPQRMARVLAEGVGADSATVWLRVGGELREAASWPAGGVQRPALPLRDGVLPAISGAAAVMPVSFGDELLGALTVSKREAMTPVEQRLLGDLARQAGLVLKNVRLNAELLQRLQELQASRQRLVTAQDSERRRMERDLHDGAQQNLVGLKINLGVASQLASRDPSRAQALLQELSRQADDAIETLRELARGIYPPILADRGLAAALNAHANRLPLPVEVRAEGLPRYPQEIEAAVYFCCLEAIQNVIKHARARRAVVNLESADGCLEFSVEDDGKGFDPSGPRTGSGLQNIADRLNALGGTLATDASPLGGARIDGTVPVASAAPHGSR